MPATCSRVPLTHFDVVLVRPCTARCPQRHEIEENVQKELASLHNALDAPPLAVEWRQKHDELLDDLQALEEQSSLERLKELQRALNDSQSEMACFSTRRSALATPAAFARLSVML